MRKSMAAGIGLMGCIWLLMGCAEVMVSGSIAGGGEYYHWFEGKRFGFFKADFGNDPEGFTQSFSCD